MNLLLYILLPIAGPENDKVGEARNRLVQMLMRGEAEDAEKRGGRAGEGEAEGAGVRRGEEARGGRGRTD